MNKIAVYGAEWCAYCKRAVEFLESKGLDHQYIDIEDPKNSHHQEFLQKERHRSIPQVYIWDNDEYQYQEHIGGYTELVKWINEKSEA